MEQSIPEYEFRTATEEFAEDIAAATRYYYNRFSDSKGFLLGYRTAEKVIKELNHYYVATLNEKYAGHILISFGLPEEFELLDWYDDKYREKLAASGKIIYIEHIVVKDEYTGKGAGKYLFRKISDYYRDYILFSSVVVKPYLNKNSLEFHKRCGFCEVAYHWNDIVDGVTYQSVYLMKEANSIAADPGHE